LDTAAAYALYRFTRSQLPTFSDINAILGPTSRLAKLPLSPFHPRLSLLEHSTEQYFPADPFLGVKSV
jgi:hypothetical protein